MRTQSLSLVLLITLVACAPVEPRKPIEQAASATSSYLAAKRSYVETLDKSLRTSDRGDSPYHLVAVTGPMWRVGDVISPDNPLNLVTDKCAIPSDKLPKPPISWASLPGLSTSKKLDFSAGLPESVLSFLGKDNTLGINFDMSRTGQFSMSSLQSTILAQDVFESLLTSECKDVLALKGGVVVRGVVEGKEVFKSGGTLAAGMNVKLLETQLFKFQYDDKGSFFELEDKAAAPKMFLVAYFPKQDRSSGDLGARPLTRAEVEVLEKLQIK